MSAIFTADVAKALRETGDALRRLMAPMLLLADKLSVLVKCRRCGALVDIDGVDHTLCRSCETAIRNRTYAVMGVILAVLSVLMIWANGAA